MEHKETYKVGPGYTPGGNETVKLMCDATVNAIAELPYSQWPVYVWYIINRIKDKVDEAERQLREREAHLVEWEERLKGRSQ